MNRPVSPRTARYLGGASVCLIFAFSLVPGEVRPHTGAPGQFEHFVAYAGTGVFFSLGHHKSKERVLACVALAALSVFMELIQQFIPGRSPGFFDAVASASGATIGLITGAGLDFALPHLVKLEGN